MEKMVNSFYKGKSVLITGHTGFKGTWLCKMLIEAEAKVTGYALPAPTKPNLYEISQIEKNMLSITGDIRDLKKLMAVFNQIKPEIVFHLAAQPIVRESYKNPVETYEINVMGTVNILECIRQTDSVRSFLNVTTDKVYKNNEWEWGYRENELLDGLDPYSNSKSCSELITHSYKDSFFSNRQISISTARAGNVIGGGDFAVDRIIPDCIRAVQNKEIIKVRNPNSIRPYQHVLEPLSAYLMIAEKQYKDRKYADYYNVGPNESDCLTTGELVDTFCRLWRKNIIWKAENVEGPHEAKYLKLDCSKLRTKFNWKPKWTAKEAVEKTIEWTKVYLNNGNIEQCMHEQIKKFYGDD